MLSIIYTVDKKHINFIRDNLNLFGLKFEEYRDYFLKHHEKIGWEGKGRF